MSRIVNDPSKVVDEMLEGYIKCHPEIGKCENNPRVMVYKGSKTKNKVGIVTGGGSGHKPAFIGYLGENMCDAVAIGEIFSSPTANSFYDAIREADQGRGVAILYGNYNGDNMNVKIAMRKAEKSGVQVMKVVANDDIASADERNKDLRRGVAGEIFMWKIAGAKASLGGDLASVTNVAQKAINQTKSIGVGTAPCTIPAVGKPNFEIQEGTMELGIGHHGERGIAVKELSTSKQIVEEILEKISDEFKMAKNDRIAILVSGLGATPVMEQYIFYNDCMNVLEKKGIHVVKSFVGNYFTSLDMKGITLTIIKLDNELEELLLYPCKSVGMVI